MRINITKYTVLSALLYIISVSASARPAFPLMQDEDGPEPPPGVFIDSFLGLMIIAAVLLAFLYFYKQSRVTEKNLAINEKQHEFDSCVTNEPIL